MQEIRFQPGATDANASITIPSDAPAIGVVARAYLQAVAAGVLTDTAATATRVDSRTVSLSVAVAANQDVVLDYLELGSVPAAPAAAYAGINS